jgi:hypothetical protein
MKVAMVCWINSPRRSINTRASTTWRRQSLKASLEFSRSCYNGVSNNGRSPDNKREIPKISKPISCLVSSVQPSTTPPTLHQRRRRNPRAHCCRHRISVITQIGLILLTGIVKNSASMMIDFALNAIHSLATRYSKRACSRFRSIMVTAMEHTHRASLR